MVTIKVKGGDLQEKCNQKTAIAKALNPGYICVFKKQLFSCMPMYSTAFSYSHKDLKNIVTALFGDR